MAIITITTDFGTKDYMAASVKGAILKEIEEVKLIEISHGISPFNISEAAYMVKNVYPDFPKGSIHIIGVDALPSESKKLIAAEIDDHYFICADNGILSLLISEIQPREVVEITLGKYNEFSNFPTRDIFVPVACHLARGGQLSMIGNPMKEFKQLSHLQPQVKEDKQLVGTVIYIDNFGNLITNITEKKFNEIRKARNFEVKVRNHTFNELVKRYSDVVKNFDEEVNYHGRGMVLFNSSGYLEIAIYKSNPTSFGSASTLFGMNLGDNILVEFISEN